MTLNCILKSGFAVNRWRRTRRALQLYDTAIRAVHSINQPLPGNGSFVHKVGSHCSQIQVIRGVNCTIQQYDRNFCVAGLLQHFIPSSRHHGRNQDRIHTLRDK